MLILLVLTGLVCLTGASFLFANERKRYRIRHMGTLVTAQVIHVKCWQDPPRANFNFEMLTGGRWWYEISAEWTDPDTGKAYVISSRAKKGRSRFQRGDRIPAYVSPYGNLLELS